MRLIFLLIFPILFFVYSCNQTQTNDNQIVKNSLFIDSSTVISETFYPSELDKTLISVPLHQHGLTLHRDKSDFLSVDLPSKHKNSVKNWWDSLPDPIRSQVLSNQIDIELVSEVVSTGQEIIDPVITDSQVETTGNFLEELIGSETDITYVVNTRIIDTQSVENTISHTNIRLLKSVPVKLDHYRTQFTMRNEDFDNDNARSLQYWWVQLPNELKEQIQSNTINVVATYHQSTILDDVQLMGMEKAMDNLSAMNEALAKIIGIRQINGTEVPFNFITPPTVPSSISPQSFVELKLVRNTPSIPIL